MAGPGAGAWAVFVSSSSAQLAAGRVGSGGPCCRYLALRPTPSSHPPRPRPLPQVPRELGQLRRLRILHMGGNLEEEFAEVGACLGGLLLCNWGVLECVHVRCSRTPACCSRAARCRPPPSSLQRSVPSHASCVFCRLKTRRHWRRRCGRSRRCRCAAAVPLLRLCCPAAPAVAAMLRGLPLPAPAAAPRAGCAAATLGARRYHAAQPSPALPSCAPCALPTTGAGDQPVQRDAAGRRSKDAKAGALGEPRAPI